MDLRWTSIALTLTLFILPALPEMRPGGPIGGAAFANFIFDLAKHMKPETAFGEPSTQLNHQLDVSQG